MAYNSYYGPHEYPSHGSLHGVDRDGVRYDYDSRDYGDSPNARYYSYSDAGGSDGGYYSANPRGAQYFDNEYGHSRYRSLNERDYPISYGRDDAYAHMRDQGAYLTRTGSYQDQELYRDPVYVIQSDESDDDDALQRRNSVYNEHGGFVGRLSDERYAVHRSDVRSDRSDSDSSSEESSDDDDEHRYRPEPRHRYSRDGYDDDDGHDDSEYDDDDSDYYSDR